MLLNLVTINLVLQAFDVFKNFYLAKHSGRILTLQPSAGTADLNALFFGKKKETEEEEGAAGGEGGKTKKHILCVNTYQMVLLLMFNTKDKVGSVHHLYTCTPSGTPVHT